MMRILAKTMLGLLLTGCTVNNYHPGSFTTEYSFSHSESIAVIIPKPEEVKGISPPVNISPLTVKKLTKGCEIYTPLPVPEPIKVDFKELEQAANPAEINAIVLKNIKELRNQFIDYKDRQQKQYAEYVKRCVVK